MLTKRLIPIIFGSSVVIGLCTWQISAHAGPDSLHGANQAGVSQPDALPPAHDQQGNEVPTFAVVDGKMVPVPDIAMGDEATIAAIFDEGVHRSQVMAIEQHLAEGIGARLTGSTHAEQANRWALEQFKSWGLDAHLDKWGEIPMRFDRGPSWGKMYMDGSDKVSREIAGLTTLAWVPGTDGPVRGRAVKMPTTMEQLNAVRDQLPGAWIVIPANLKGSSGIRGITGSVRSRYKARAAIREQGVDAILAEHQPDHTQADETADNSDPFAGTWKGTLSGGPLGDQSYPLTLKIKRASDGNIESGKLGVGETVSNPIEKAAIDGDTITFEWQSSRGRSKYVLKAHDGKLTGTATRVDNDALRFDIKFARAGAAAEPIEADYLLASVLAMEPAGFVSSSKDERVWTSMINDWRSMTPERAKLYRDVEVVISEPDYDYINSKLADGGELDLEFNMDNQLSPGPVPVYNTVAEIKGSEHPEQVVIVSAHLDSWNGPGSQGAVDNGTGASVTLEAARILAAAGAQPKRTIRFILWTGEEQGLLGSSSYVNRLSDEEKANIVCCTVDDGGTNTQGGIRGIESMREYLAAATAPINGRIWDDTDGKYLNVDVKVQKTMPKGGGSDHASFNAVGIPGFYWDEVGRANYRYAWHTQHDRFDQVIENYLIQSATNSAIFAYNMACAPEMLARQNKKETNGEKP